MDTYTERQIRLFRPVILFHDYPTSPMDRHQYQYRSSGNATLNGFDSGKNVQQHKQRITDMLKVNGKIWSELIKNTRQWNSSPSSPTQDSSSLQSPLPPIHLPSSSSMGSLYDDQPIISPTTSTSSSSSSSGSSSSSLSSSSSSTLASSLPLTVQTSSPPPNLPSLHHYYQKQSHWPQQQQQPSFLPLSPTLHSSSPPPPARPQQEQTQDHQHHDLHYQLHMDTLCLDHLDKRRRGNLPKPVTAILKKWLLEHCRNPYPTEEEKLQLKNETHLTLNQISNWFINARRRTLPVILAKLNHHYPGIKARRRRRRQRQDKTKTDQHPTNMKKANDHHHLG
ncbi:homeobox KN domain-domain-containing protein [Absidia repens]|uniref:Homeobox KN domain-domain-containing protein n=1 Tax=Absidia repens TaxID=90262 RepID=A0A1X2IUC6_9FUNG|nr:homeobox KN domain-domain-containing protein [Absidia repens]